MQIKNYIYILALIALAGCIKPYDPEFNQDAIQKYVVEGMVINQEGWQTVSVSLSSSLGTPQYLPVAFCHVTIVDDVGNEFILEEFEEGQHRVWMNTDDLVLGRSYKLKVNMPNGHMLESAFDKMNGGPEVDDIYYEIVELPTNNPEVNNTGIQVYTNLIAHEEQSRFYRWKLTETWEYHSAYPKEFYYDGMVHQIEPPDFSEMYCWRTEKIDEIFTLSTNNIVGNTYNKFPLQFLSSETEKLAVLYSMYIEQIALSESAYNYWEQLRQNNGIGEGLYAQQPLAIKGNITNLSNPDENILGFFQVCSMSTKRVFIEPVEGLELDFSDKCSPRPLLRGVIEISPQFYPAYLMTVYGSWSPILLNDKCVNCTLRGGTLEKPEFWPI